MRTQCIGGCGRLVVTKVSAECRKCRRQRRRAGLKRLVKAVGRSVYRQGNH